MEVFREMKKYLLLFAFAIGTLHLPSDGHAQSQLKKVRMGSLQPTALFWLFMPRFTVDFFRDEGIDLEIIFMPVNLASTAFLNGDVDYSGRCDGTIGAAVRR